MVNKGPRVDRRSLAGSTPEGKEPPREEEEEDFELVPFQASLDQSVNAAKQLIDSWIPEEFGKGDVASTSVQSLRDKARPPRMGLGASPAAVHKQQAEDRKLKERLLGKGRNGILGDEGSIVHSGGIASTSSVGGARAEGGNESETDEEDSRSRLISKKTAQAPASTGTTKQHASNNPFVSTNKNHNPVTPRKPDNAPPPLFNDPSPSKPSPASATRPPATTDSKKFSTKTIASSSFYPSTSTSATANASTTSEGAGLSKNQRKKLRKLEREQEHKKRLQEESRKEEELERTGGQKRARDDDEGSGEEGETAETVQADHEEQEDTSVATVENGLSAGGDDSRQQHKKKKKRKGKGKGPVGDTPPAAVPLLNL